MSATCTTHLTTLEDALETQPNPQKDAAADEVCIGEQVPPQHSTGLM
jgi:hypothetical protein